jgi:hypothetical protein
LGQPEKLAEEGIGEEAAGAAATRRHGALGVDGHHRRRRPPHGLRHKRLPAEHRAGRTTILVSHRPAVILRANWIVFMENGQVRRQSPPQELRQHRDLAPYLQAA